MAIITHQLRQKFNLPQPPAPAPARAPRRVVQPPAAAPAPVEAPPVPYMVETIRGAKRTEEVVK